MSRGVPPRASCPYPATVGAPSRLRDRAASASRGASMEFLPAVSPGRPDCRRLDTRRAGRSRGSSPNSRAVPGELRPRGPGGGRRAPQRLIDEFEFAMSVEDARVGTDRVDSDTVQGFGRGDQGVREPSRLHVDHEIVDSETGSTIDHVQRQDVRTHRAESQRERAELPGRSGSWTRSRYDTCVLSHIYCRRVHTRRPRGDNEPPASFIFSLSEGLL